jgi:4-hydroxybenzoate polyprenyltransferase
MTWAKDRSDGFIRFVGTSELLGALGVVLPLATGILPWLTPLAAIGLALIQVLAIGTEHLPKKEFKVLPVNLVLLALSLFIVIGRWSLIS